jgi:hypothetical protein
MQLAYKLGLDDEVVLSWPKTKFERWYAFLQIDAERQAKANKR